MSKKSSLGFTLIELIIVIAIIAILAAAIFVAVDPARRLNETRNARRNSDITTILDGVVKYSADNEGAHYAAVAGLTVSNYYVIGTCAAGANTTCTAKTTQAACVNLSGIGTGYLGTVPMDPKTGTAENTDYYLMRDANGAITVGACDTEGEEGGGSGTPPVVELVR